MKTKFDSSGSMRQNTVVWASWNGHVEKDTQPFGIRNLTGGVLLVKTHTEKQLSMDNFKLWNGCNKTDVTGLLVLVLLLPEAAIFPSCSG